MLMKTILGMPDTKQRFLKNQLGFLRDIVKAYLIRFPFQNISSMGQFLPLDRTAPRWKEFLQANFRGSGGLCCHNNIFLGYQLETLGFDVKHHQGSFNRTPVPRAHNVISIKIHESVSKERVKQTKTYLVDVGCGIPLHEPICLEELPYIARGAGFEFRYERLDENTVGRRNIAGDSILGKKHDTYISPQDYKMYLNPVTLPESLPPVARVYEDPFSVFLHQGVYCFRYLDFSQDDFSIVCARGTDIMFYTKETRHVESYETYERLEPQLLKYFPMIEPSAVRATIENFKIPLKELLEMNRKQRFTASA